MQKMNFREYGQGLEAKISVYQVGDKFLFHLARSLKLNMFKILIFFLPSTLMALHVPAKRILNLSNNRYKINDSFYYSVLSTCHQILQNLSEQYLQILMSPLHPYFHCFQVRSTSSLTRPVSNAFPLVTPFFTFFTSHTLHFTYISFFIIRNMLMTTKPYLQNKSDYVISQFQTSLGFLLSTGLSSALRSPI